jgi:hypothetical protein
MLRKPRTYAPAILVAMLVLALAVAGVATAAVAKLALSKPVTPASVKGKALFTTSGTVKPGKAGATKLYYYRLHQGKWRLYEVRNASTTAGTVGKYTLRKGIPYSGSWRVKAYRPEGGGSWSVVKSFSVVGGAGQPSGIACTKGCH